MPSIWDLDLYTEQEYILPKGCGNPPVTKDTVVRITKINSGNSHIFTAEKITINLEDAKKLRPYTNPTSQEVLDSSK